MTLELRKQLDISLKTIIYLTFLLLWQPSFDKFYVYELFYLKIRLKDFSKFRRRKIGGLYLDHSILNSNIL